MERDEFTLMVANGRGEERGAGGKVRKPPPRKPAPVPFPSPPESGQHLWISKLVDPACRLIAGGATRIFPSFLFKTASTPARTGHDYDTEDQGEWQTGEQSYADADDDCKYSLQLGTSKSTEMASTSDISDKLKKNSHVDMHKQDEGEKSENNSLSEIEQLLKKEELSRDEIRHLMEILNSRTVDIPNVEQGRENQNLTAKNNDKGILVTHRVSKISKEQKHGELNGAIWGSSTPLVQSKVQDEFGASPIDVARACMNSHASEGGPNRETIILDSKSTVLLDNEAAMKPHIPLPSPKPSTYWPGAVVHDTYLSPQNESRYGLPNFPRTPYSRTILLKSKSRSIHMQGDYNLMSSTPLLQSRTPLYGQDKPRGDGLESGYGSFGPIRRIRHNKDGGQSSSRRPIYFHPSLKDPSRRESSDAHEGFIPSVTKSQEHDGTSSTYKFHSLDNKLQGSEVGVPTVHTHTCLMARKMLEHIDRNPPTPKEKSAELKLATKWKNPESSVDFSTVLSNDVNYLLKSKDLGPCKYDRFDGKKSTLNEGQGKSNVDKPKESTEKYVNVRNERSLPSDTKVDNSILLGNNAGNLQNSGGSHIFRMKCTDEDALKTPPSGGRSCAVNQAEKPVSDSSLSKPVLPSISVNKPELSWNFASHNKSGFTSPVSASFVFSEPSTPSIIPSFPSGDQNQSKESTPSYTFGLKNSSSVLVFSYPSTGSIPVLNDAGDINFSFVSNEKARLSFSSFGNNAVCY